MLVEGCSQHDSSIAVPTLGWLQLPRCCLTVKSHICRRITPGGPGRSHSHVTELLCLLLLLLPSLHTQTCCYACQPFPGSCLWEPACGGHCRS